MPSWGEGPGHEVIWGRVKRRNKEKNRREMLIPEQQEDKAKSAEAEKKKKSKINVPKEVAALIGKTRLEKMGLRIATPLGRKERKE